MVETIVRLSKFLTYLHLNVGLLCGLYMSGFWSTTTQLSCSILTCLSLVKIHPLTVDGDKIRAEVSLQNTKHILHIILNG